MFEGSVVRGLFLIMIRRLQRSTTFDMLIGTLPVKLLPLLRLRFRILLLWVACATSLLARLVSFAASVAIDYTAPTVFLDGMHGGGRLDISLPVVLSAFRLS